MPLRVKTVADKVNLKIKITKIFVFKIRFILSAVMFLTESAMGKNL